MQEPYGLMLAEERNSSQTSKLFTDFLALSATNSSEIIKIKEQYYYDRLLNLPQ
jgi:hypothetical protein